MCHQFLKATLGNLAQLHQFHGPYPSHAFLTPQAPWFCLGFSSTRTVASSDGRSGDVSKYVNLPAEKLRGQDCWIQGGPKRPVMDRLALPKTWQKLWMFLFQGSYPPPKTDSSSMKIGRAPKGNDRLPTIHFQVLLLLVSGRV